MREVLKVQRLFVGIELPVSVQQVLEAVRTDYPSARWHPARAMHVTLSFIGIVDQATGARMAAALADLSAAELELAIRGVGYFGSEARPTVLWAGVEARRSLLELQQLVEQRLVAAGLVADERPYRPHVTLARGKSGADALQGFLAQYADLVLPTFPVSEVCLYVSRGGSAGVEYEVIERFSLLKR